MTKISVLLMLHELTLTGAPRVALDFFGSLTDAVDLHIITYKSGPIEQNARSLGTVTFLLHDWDVNTLKGRIQRRLFRRQLEQSLEQWKPDVIYVNSVAALSMLNMYQWPDVPVLMHVHELEAVIEFFTRGMEAQFRERPARYIAISEAVRQSLITRFSIDANKIAVVYECIATSLSQQQWNAIETDDTRFVVGNAGAPETRKGITLWLEMAAALVARVGMDKVRFVWVGMGDTFDSSLFRVIARKMGLEDCVEFVPLTPDPWEHFATFDVFTVTSWEEAFSIVMAENMIMGTPGLCFADCGGTPEVIGDTGIVVPGFSPVAMAEAIAELMQSPERRADMGRRARARVLENFLPEVQAPKIEQQIRRLVGSNAKS